MEFLIMVDMFFSIFLQNGNLQLMQISKTYGIIFLILGQNKRIRSKTAVVWKILSLSWAIGMKKN